MHDYIIRLLTESLTSKMFWILMVFSEYDSNTLCISEIWNTLRLAWYICDVVNIMCGKVSISSFLSWLCTNLIGRGFKSSFTFFFKELIINIPRHLNGYDRPPCQRSSCVACSKMICRILSHTPTFSHCLPVLCGSGVFNFLVLLQFYLLHHELDAWHPSIWNF